jgi:hypothetical protein
MVGAARDLRVLALESAGGSVRLLVGNEAHCYTLGRIDLGREIKGVQTVGHFPGLPIFPEGRCLEERVPPRGMAALEVEVQEAGPSGGAGNRILAV